MVDSNASAGLPSVKSIALWAGPLGAVLISLMVNIQQYPQASHMLGIALWMALWWITECVPLAVTALLPLLLFPLFGIASTKDVAPRYMSSTIFLFMGGFLIAQAMERTGLHRRVAMAILARCHAGPMQVLAGFAVTTAVLSMWISNTAATMLMVTIAIAVLARLDEQSDDKAMLVTFAPALLLTIAYSSNIGGMGTPVGTVPNLVFLETMDAFSAAHRPSFLQWMLMGLPMVVVGLGIVLFFMARRTKGLSWNEESAGGALLQAERLSLGAMRGEEKRVAWVLSVTALAWVSREGIQIGSSALPGWSALLPYPGVDDGTVAVAGGLTLFFLGDGQGRRILDQHAIGRLPWGVLVLLGGGFALALGMQVSGLSNWLAEQMKFLGAAPLPVTMLVIAMVMTWLTEMTSNTAITQVMLPVLAALAAGTAQDMTMILMSATLAASCAFMLPVATPPNAIVFGTERVMMRDMLKAGIRLNVIMPFVIITMVSLIRPLWP